MYPVHPNPVHQHALQVTQVDSEAEEEEGTHTFDHVNDSEEEDEDLLKEQLQVVTPKVRHQGKLWRNQS